MGSVIFSMVVSMDGFVEDPEGSIGFGAPSDDLHRYFNRRAAETQVHLLGRRIYEVMEPYWPDIAATPTGEEVTDEFAQIWVDTPRIVFSTTLDEVGPGCELRREIDEEEIRGLSDQPGIINVGGASLASELAALGLVDQVEMAIRPVILGGGRPMFGSGFCGLEFQPIDSTAFASGERVLRYRAVRDERAERSPGPD